MQQDEEESRGLNAKYEIDRKRIRVLDDMWEEREYPGFFVPTRSKCVLVSTYTSIYFYISMYSMNVHVAGSLLWYVALA